MGNKESRKVVIPAKAGIQLVKTRTGSPLKACGDDKLTNSKGVGLIAVLLIVAMLGLIGGVITTLVATGAVAKTNDLVREQAFYLTHAGFEYALKRADDGVNPNGDSKNLGNGQFTVGYQNNGLITITSNVSAMQGASSPSFSIQGPPIGGMSDCLTVNTAAATLGNGNTELQGLTLQNTCNAAITISAMTVSWDPNAAERLNVINIGGTTVYNSVAGIVSGAVADITDYTIPACTTVALTYIRFSADMSGKNFTLVFTMSDGSTKTAFVQAINNNEAACLNVDMSAAAVGFTNFVRLLNGTLTNSCASMSIRIDKMTVSWSPVTPARTMSTIRINNANVWSGSVGSGVQVNLTSQVTIAASSSATQDYLNFNSDMRGYNYTIVYTMRDATTKTVSVNLYETTPASCLQVNTAGCSYSGTLMIGQTWQNICPLRIVVDRVMTNWTGSGSQRWTSLTVNGTSVWTGSVNKGTTANISNVDIPGSTTYPVNSYGFNTNMTSRCVNHTMTMFPSGTVNVPQFCP